MPPQSEFSHTSVQHSDLELQLSPSGLHSTPPQNPAAQFWLQQSTLVSQALPSGKQICSGLQMSSLQIKVSQHDLSSAGQGSPSAMQSLPASSAGAMSP